MNKRIPPLATIPLSEVKKIQHLLPAAEPPLKGKRIIPVCEPNLSSREKRYLNQAFDSSWLSSSGEYVERFENTFAQTVSHTPYAFAVNSGTTALHVALVALGIGTGDEVIIPTFTMIATINAVTYCQATPVLVDSDPTTWNMDTAAIEKLITSKTKAIIVVHTYGAPVDMDPVMHIAKKYNLWVIEDAAEAHGATYKGQAVGSLGDIAAFSFYGNKLITTGEGGMVTTKNKEIGQRVDLLRNHAFSKDRHFWHAIVGFGYRMTNLQAAVGLAQTERFASLLQAKRTNAALYTTLLADVAGITPPYHSAHTLHSYWMYSIRVDKKAFGMDRNQLRAHLASHGIETRSFFVPIHLQPAYYATFRKKHFPIAESLCADGLYLPSSSQLPTRDIRSICALIKQASGS